MSRMIFVNLPVADLPASIAFYEAVGFTRDDRFADASAQMMTLSEHIHVMLLTHARFNDFTPRKVVDARDAAEVLLGVSADDRDHVDRWVGRAAAAGGRADPTPRRDYGAMYGRSFADLDGHIWETMWMDVDAFLAQMADQGAAEQVPA